MLVGKYIIYVHSQSDQVLDDTARNDLHQGNPADAIRSGAPTHAGLMAPGAGSGIRYRIWPCSFVAALRV